MKSTQATKDFAQQINAMHAANGLTWNSPEGRVLAEQIRQYKARVIAHHRRNGMTWKDWQGDIAAMLKAVPLDLASINAPFHVHVVIDVFSTRLLGRRKAA